MCGSLREPDWKERIKAAAEGRTPNIARPLVNPYYLQIYGGAVTSGGQYVIEVRPRAGTWSPFVAAIPAAEAELVKIVISHGPAGRIPNNIILFNTASGITSDGQWAFETAQNEATPTQSYFIYCEKLPSRLLFGVDGGSPQYIVELGSDAKK